MDDVHELGSAVVAWSPRYVDKPLRFLFDPEVWVICCAEMGVLMLFGVNQTLALLSMIPAGMVLQRVVDHNRPGYLKHVFYSVGLLNIFCRYGKYRF